MPLPKILIAIKADPMKWVGFWSTIHFERSFEYGNSQLTIGHPVKVSLGGFSKSEKVVNCN